VDKIGDILGSILGSVFGFVGAFLPADAWPPTEWPAQVFASLVILALMIGAVYVWRRLGKGLLFVLIAFAAFIGLVVVSMKSGR
jgi:hypothetical protein